jgi:hypothetical protein
MSSASTLELARQADRIELAAFTDMYAAAPPKVGARIEHIADATLLIAPLLPMGLFNRAIGLGVTQPVASNDIDAIVDRFETAGSPKYFIHSAPASDPSLVPLLEERGFALGQPPFWAKTVLIGNAEPLATELIARPVKEGEVPRFAEVICSAFGMPPFMNGWIQTMAARPEWTGFGAFDGENMLAAGMRWQGSEGTWLGMAGTLPDARGRGAQSALLRARSEGAPGLVTTETWLPPPGEHNTSLANMHRAGFITVAERANYQKQR